jgi:hypothetical protein
MDERPEPGWYSPVLFARFRPGVEQDESCL